MNLKPNNPNEKVVTFHEVEIRTYELDLSDNPSCCFGPAIGLGWKYEVIGRQKVEEFEGTRPSKLSLENLKLTPEERHQLLDNPRFTKEEKQKCFHSIMRGKYQRKDTIANLSRMRYDEMKENVKIRLMHILRLKRKDVDLKKLWPGYEENPVKHNELRRLSSSSQSTEDASDISALYAELSDL